MGGWGAVGRFREGLRGWPGCLLSKVATARLDLSRSFTKERKKDYCSDGVPNANEFTPASVLFGKDQNSLRLS